MHITQRDFRYPQTSAQSERTLTNQILTPQSTNQDKHYLTHIKGGNGSTRRRDFTIDRNHTISCRHWASSTFKFPTYRENSESTNKDSTLNLPSALRRYRCRLYHRKGRWTGKSSKQLSNTTHFYKPTPKLNALTDHKPNIPNQRKTTSYQATQPINSIATDRGFQCNRTKETEVFSST